MLFENVISRVVSRLFIIHAPQDPLVDWRRSAYLIDFCQPLIKNLKIPLSWPSRCGFWRRNGSKSIYFIGSLRIPINSISSWSISGDFLWQEIFCEIMENSESNQMFRIWSLSFKFPKIPSQRPDPTKWPKSCPINRHIILSFIRAQALALTPPPSAKYRGSGVEGSRLDKRSYTVVHALVFGFLDTTH